MILCYPFRKKIDITCDWKEPVVFNGKTITHSGQDTSNIQLHKIAEREKNTDYLHVLAMTNGVVKEVKEWGKNGSLGWGVQVFYPELGITKLSLHLLKALVKVGQKVKIGQPIAVVGKGIKQTIAEHTHEAYEKGDKLSSGLMGSYTQNPYNYTKQMKLLSVIEKPPIIVVPPDLPEPTVTVKESLWKKINQDLSDELRNVNALKDIVHDLNIEIGNKNTILMQTQTDRDLYKFDAIHISQLLNKEYSNEELWDIKKFGYYEVIQKLKETEAKKLSKLELVMILINKLFNK